MKFALPLRFRSPATALLPLALLLRECHLEPLMLFLRTDQEPAVYWLLLDSSEAKIEALHRKLAELSEALDAHVEKWTADLPSP